MRLFSCTSMVLYIGLLTALNLQFMLERMLHNWLTDSVASHEYFFDPPTADADNNNDDDDEISIDFDPEQHLGACLIVMDDNHYLIEWLAYHYHVANLRHLIVTSDPNSITKPTRILDRWRDRIIIDEWQSDDFLPDDFDHLVKTRATRGRKTKDAVLQNHRARQAVFNIECLRMMQVMERKWVMMTDTDEYITPNPDLPIVSHKSSNGESSDSNSEDDKRNAESGRIPVPKLGTQGSVATILNGLHIPNRQYPALDSPCIPMHRRQFTTHEDKTTMPRFVPDGDVTDYRAFQTLRWRKYGQKSKQYALKNFDETCKRHLRIPNKVVINVQDSDLFHKKNLGNPHRPLHSCAKDVYLKEDETPLLVNHYMGTEEQWLYRAGDKRGLGFRKARFYDLNYRAGRYTSEDISVWLAEFVAVMGEEEAAILLEGVGELEPLNASVVAPTAVVEQGSSDDEAYEEGELVQANYKGDGYWYFAEVIDVLPGGYYNLVYEDCTQDLATHGKLIRRHGRVSVH